MSIRERYQLQAERANKICKLAHLLDRYRHNKNIQETIEQEEKEKRARQEAGQPEFKDMPDAIQLLVDTRILKKLDMNYKEFMIEFNNEVYVLTANQKSIFGYEGIGEVQSKKLQQLTGYTEDDLSIMDWVDAQALIGVFNAQKPISDRQSKFLKFVLTKRGFSEENINKRMPRTSRKANKLINELTGASKYKKSGSVRRGRA